MNPLQIGNVTLSYPLFLAPMAGVTDYAFRKLCREMGAAGAQRAKDFSVAAFYEHFVRIVEEFGGRS